MIRFDLTLANGAALHDIRIQGHGGELGGAVAHLIGTPSEEHALQETLQRLQRMIRAANEGKPLAIYEPAPGHIKVYHGPANSDRAEVVDVRGATATIHREGNACAITSEIGGAP